MSEIAVDGTHGTHRQEHPIARRLAAIQQEVSTLVASVTQARATIDRLNALERAITSDERKALVRLHLETEGHLLRVRELRDEFERLRSTHG
jgi:hypothetical protein